ncbi:MAG: hypothetical protein ABI443_03140 [Chthoniobacterales bacterium]
MRSLFIIGLKLLGVLVFYWACLWISQLGFFILSLSAQKSASVWSYASISVPILFQFVFAFLLLCRTEAIANVLHVGEVDGESPQIPTASLLYVVLVGVGVYILLESVPKFVRDLIYIMQSLQSPQGAASHQIIEIIGSALQVFLGYLVLQRAGAMARTLLSQKS